jgi:predicted transcriptional regulator
MGRTSSVGEFLRSRKSPVTIEQIADGAGVSDKTARNYVTEQSRVANWIGDNEYIVVLHGQNGNQYCVRNKSDVKGTMKVGKASWNLADRNDFKAHYTR